MLQGIDLNQRVEYSDDSDSEPKTIFVLRPLSGVEMIDLGGAVKTIDGKAVLSGLALYGIVEKSVVEIKNFGRDLPREEILKSLSPLSLGKLANRITELNNITADEKKI